MQLITFIFFTLKSYLLVFTTYFRNKSKVDIYSVSKKVRDLQCNILGDNKGQSFTYEITIGARSRSWVIADINDKLVLI